MTFLMDKDARPTPKDMKLWVDCVRFIKRGAKGGALGFFTYMELSKFDIMHRLLSQYFTNSCNSHLACPVPYFPPGQNEMVRLANMSRLTIADQLHPIRLFFILQGWGVAPAEYRK